MQKLKPCTESTQHAYVRAVSIFLIREIEVHKVSHLSKATEAGNRAGEVYSWLRSEFEASLGQKTKQKPQ